MTGRTVVLTGATNGIGLESAAQLAALGHRLVLVGRNPEKLTAAAGRELPGRVVATFLRGTPTVLDGKLA